MLARLIGEDIEIAMLAGDELPPVLADRAQLEQVIINLAINARDAMPERRHAGDRDRAAPDEHVRLAVTDTGVGHRRRDVLERIFEPFFTTKDVGLGTGLGLATVHGIVTQSGGRVDVSSAARARARRSPSACPPPPDERGGPDAGRAPRAARGSAAARRCWCARTRTACGTLLELVLTGAGYTVLVAGRPEDALALARAEGDAIDALVTDIVMPGMSGLELAERLAPLRALFISGYSAEAADRRRPAAGQRVPARSRSTTARCWPRSARCWTRRAPYDPSHDRREHGLRRAGRAPPARGPRRLADDGHARRRAAAQPRVVLVGRRGHRATSSASRTPPRTRNIEANRKVSLNFAGDGSGGDIVILSGVASLEPDDAGAHSSTAYVAEVRWGFERLGLTPEQFAQRYSIAAAHPPHQGPRAQVIRRVAAGPEDAATRRRAADRLPRLVGLHDAGRRDVPRRRSRS